MSWVPSLRNVSPRGERPLSPRGGGGERPLSPRGGSSERPLSPRGGGARATPTGSVSFIRSSQSFADMNPAPTAVRRRALSPNPHWRRPLSPRGSCNRQSQPMYASADAIEAALKPLSGSASSSGSPTSSVADAPLAHAPERLEALAASRAQAYKVEVEELRSSLARSQLKMQQQAEDHAAKVASLTAELDARGRGEMLARTRCEAAEVELRAARPQLNKLRESARRDSSARQETLSDDLLLRCQGAMRRLAVHGFAASVLSWRRRALRAGIGGWLAACRLIDATAAEDRAAAIMRHASSFARAEAAAADPSSTASLMRDVQRGQRVRRLRNYFAGVTRAGLSASLADWRLAACATAAEDDLRDVAGRLRAAQAGERATRAIHSPCLPAAPHPASRSPRALVEARTPIDLASIASTNTRTHGVGVDAPRLWLPRHRRATPCRRAPPPRTSEPRCHAWR